MVRSIQPDAESPRTFMKTDLSHLPLKKQRELERVVEILFEELNGAMARGTAAWKKEARILKIILFGSYARGTWVDEPHTSKGYQSDYDLLIMVNRQELTQMADYWYQAEDRLMREEAIKTPVNFIVHSKDEVHQALVSGQYFFTDIGREGIALYDLKGHRLPEPTLPTPQAAYEMAQKHFEEWSDKASSAYRSFELIFNEGLLNDAVFMLHQATERAYCCLLLVLTNYRPNTHNVKFTRSLAEDLDARLIAAWPRESRHDRRCFELLKHAYVEARYSEHYAITEEELTWLGERVETLQSLTEQVCQERLVMLKEEAAV